MEKYLRASMLIASIFLVVSVITTVVNNRVDYFKSIAVNHDLQSVTTKDRERQLNCLAQNIYHEAAGEPFEGKVAVAQVTINRAESGKYPNDICAVIYQKNVFMSKVVCQFSWYCNNAGQPPIKHKAAYHESYEVAKKVLLENFRLSSLKHAMFYHADYVNPNWGKERITQIGRHIFYKG